VFDNGERKTEASLFHLKTRFEELGHECRLDLKYDLSTGRFRSTDYEAAMPRQKPNGRDQGS
jgi:twinkle protein